MIGMKQVFNLGFSLICFVAPLLIANRDGYSYDTGTHYQLVIDAIDYMSRHQEKVAYADGSTPSSDFDLLQKVLAPGLKDDQEIASRIRVAGTILAQSSADTDQLQDVWLHLGWYYGSQTSGLGISFTTFSHFLNVFQPGLLWSSSGYHYGWVHQNKDCYNGYYKDFAANVFIKYSGGKFLPQRSSDTFLRYEKPLRDGVQHQIYQQEFDQTIDYIHFWPITNMASYWFNSFLNDPSRGESSQPFNLPHLGPALHAAGDTTVPFHAVGLSGCGHVEYETEVEAQYGRDKKLYDPARVKQWLVTGEHLKKDISLDDILVGNAKKAASSCNRSLLSADCPVVRKTAVAQELVNLSIASTVIVVRKAFSEWLKKTEAFTDRKKVDVKRGRVKLSKLDVDKIGFKDWAEVPIKPPSVKASDRSVATSVQSDLVSELGKMKKHIVAFQRGELDGAAFQARLNGAVEDAARVVQKNPAVTWEPSANEVGIVRFRGMPPVGPAPIRFRLPTSAEIEDDRKWSNYLTERAKFFDAEELYKTAYAAAVSKATPIQRLSSKEKAEFEISVNKLQKDFHRDLASYVHESAVLKANPGEHLQDYRVLERKQP